MAFGYDDPNMMDPMLRQRQMGVNPTNFNPEAQGVSGFAPSMGMEQNQPQPQPQPMMQEPMQMPQHMQMMNQRLMANRNQQMGMTPQSAPPMGGYRDLSGMNQNQMQMNRAQMMRERPAQALPSRPAMPQADPYKFRTPDFNPAANKPMGRVAGGLGMAGSAMGLANQARNIAKKPPTKKPAAKAAGQLPAPPTF